MKQTGYDYDVKVTFTINGKELNALMALSKEHYDTTCMFAGERGGFLYGLANRWITFEGGAQNRDDYVTLEEMAILPNPGLDFEIEVTLTGRELGILSKIGEGEAADREDGVEHFGFTHAFSQMLKDRREVYYRLVPEGTGLPAPIPENTYVHSGEDSKQ